MRTRSGECLIEKNAVVLYRLPNLILVVTSESFSWAGHLARMEDNKSAFKIITNRIRKILLGQSRRSCDDNIRTDLKEVGVTVKNFIH